METKKESFSYVYSAKQQEEINNIRKKYIQEEDDKMERLRRLDQSAAKPGTIAAMSIGIISCLIFGAGMCCTMVWTDTLFIPGIIIGIVGLAGLSAAYPIYTHITRKRREKLAPEILCLTDELRK